MNISDWIISISAGGLALALAIAGYFAQKWIQSVDETIKENSNSLKTLNEKFYSYKVASKLDSKHLLKTVEDEHGVTRNRTLSKLDKIEQDVACMQAQVKNEILPALKNATEKLGHVLILEDRTLNQEKNMIKLFEAVQALARKFPPQK